ncbi:MAG: ParA family protein [Coleofasciculus sp. S288]|nr:ParA family protein [Coleofasciculus sp. S288]
MIVILTALKGGVGKTTSAIHIAAYLQQKAPTLLIDADKNRSALVWSRDEKLPFRVISEAAAPKFIQRYQHLVVDTKARPEREDLEDLVTGSDLLILPTTPNPLDIDATLKAVELLGELKAKFKILLTRVDSRTNSGREARKSLTDLNLPLFKTDIPKLIAFERAPQRGVIVKDYPNPRAQLAWDAYKAIGREILP